MAFFIDLSGKYYLFSNRDVTKTGLSDDDHLVITSHGSYSGLWGPLGSSRTEVPTWATLHFYTSHGSTLANPGNENMLQQSVIAKPPVGPGSMVTNYTLSKFQGRHGNNSETYGSIDMDLEDNSIVMNTLKRGKTVQAWKRNSKQFDVVTVRNKSFQGSRNLKDLLSVLHNHNLRYKNIHCSFCRSNMHAFSHPSESCLR